MPIDPTRATTAITALLRRVLQTSGQVQGRSSGQQASAAAGGAGKGRQRQSGKSRDVAESITRRISALNPDDPAFAHRALRVLVESALLHEFGDSLLNAPHFQGIVELVVGQLESSPLMAQEVATVVAHLKSGGAAPPSSSPN